MHNLILTSLDSPIVPTRQHHFAEQHTAIAQPNNIRLAVQPGIVRRRPRSRNDLLALAQLAFPFSGPFASRAGNLRRSATSLALAIVLRHAPCIRDYLSDVILIPGLIAATV